MAAPLVAWVSAAGVLLSTLYNMKFLHGLGIYSCIMSWQLTIVSIHVAPIIALRQLRLGGSIERIALGSWCFLSVGMREGEYSLFSLAFVLVEVLAAWSDLSLGFLDALLVLQPVIVVGFWFGILVASFSKSFTFLPLDRHLHQGLAHVARSWSAKRCLLHEFVGHFVSQAALSGLLVATRSSEEGLLQELLRSEVIMYTLVIVTAYAFVVVATAALVPAHELPYNLGTIPACFRVERLIRFAQELPAEFRGRGCTCDHRLLTLPPWMQDAPYLDSTSGETKKNGKSE